MVRIAYVRSNPSGKDLATRLNEEYVAITNRGINSVNMSGWLLSDVKSHVYQFKHAIGGKYWSLGPGEYVFVHTGSGTDTYTPPVSGHPGRFQVYWGNGWWIWNNEGDVASLYDSSGNLVHRYTVSNAA